MNLKSLVKIKLNQNKKNNKDEVSKYDKTYFVYQCKMHEFRNIQEFLINNQGYLWKMSGAKILSPEFLGPLDKFYIVVNVKEKTLGYKISEKGFPYIINYLKDKYGESEVYNEIYNSKTLSAFKILIRNEIFLSKVENKTYILLERFDMFNIDMLEDTKVLYAFDMDDTLVYGQRFESYVKYLIKEYLTPEDILMKELDEVGIELSELKYDNGRIYFDDTSDIEISKNSDWIRKKDRIYLKQPEYFFLSDYSLPTNTNDRIVDIYHKAVNKCIITVRKDLIKTRTEKSLADLGIEEPNYGLHMYPSIEHKFKSEWKIDEILKICDENEFKTVHYFDDNIKLIKKMKRYYYTIQTDVDVYFYRVNKNNYRAV